MDTPLRHQECILRDPLRPHQEVGKRWMQVHENTLSPRSGGIIADEMGLGKTLTVIATVLDLHRQGIPLHRNR